MALDKITTGIINDDAVTAAKIVAGAVGTSEIADGTVVAADIGADAVGISELSATGTASSTTFLRGDNAWVAVNTDLVGDTTPQLGGALDAQGNNITDVGNIETSTTTKIKQKGEFMTHSIHRSWVMGG